MLKGGGLLAACSGGEQVLRFFRTVIIARVLSTEDYGIGATFTLTTMLLAMATDMGFERMLVQAKDGDDKKLCATAQTILLLRGLVLGAILFVAGGWIAKLFHAERATWAFRCIALLPIFQGLMHRDVVRFQRALRYGPYVLCTLLPSAVTLLLAWPVTRVWDNYWALLILTLVSGLMELAISHVVGEHRVQFGWDRQLAMRFVHFGWPLLFNGGLLFGTMQGDRLIVGTAYDLSSLGVYTVAVMMTLTPRTALIRINSRLMLPVMSQAQSDPKRFADRYEFYTQTLGLFSALIVVVLIIAGAPLVGLLFGAKYDGVSAFIGWLAAMQMVRLTRAAQNTSAMALGDTGNPTWSSAARSLVLIPSAWVAFTVRSPESIVWMPIFGLCGEVLAYWVGTGLLKRKHGLRMTVSLKSMTLPVGAALLAGGLSYWEIGSSSPWSLAGTTIGAVGLTLAVGLVAYPRFRAEMTTLLRRRPVAAPIDMGPMEQEQL